jgi:hypothetical protein
MRTEMTQKTLSIRELALLPTGHPVSFTMLWIFGFELMDHHSKFIK